MKRAVKQALMNAYLASGWSPARDRLYAHLGRSRLTVLCYHQVTDPANDYSTVGTAAFREQMQYIKHHYSVVSLTEGVAALRTLGTARRLVAVTFDDGYRDNAAVAAPILESLGLPACFFVSTDLIGSTRPFPHDLAQCRPPQDHLTWADLRSLVSAGFEIGSHTCSHADMGVLPLPEAEVELRRSREHLEQELGVRVRSFAFPYGHRRNMRPDTVAAARREYEICCSAYGGHNTAPIDSSNVRRVVISTGVTFLAFRAILEGWPIFRRNNPYRARPETTQQPTGA